MLSCHLSAWLVITSVQLRMHMFVCTFVYVLVFTCVYVYVHMCMYTHMHMCMSFTLHNYTTCKTIGHTRGVM